MAYEALAKLLRSDTYYSSFMTDHDIDRSKQVFCTDTSIGIVGAINELLVYSNRGMIQALPALPLYWRTGSVTGLLSRTQASIDITWNLDKEIVSVLVHSFKEQKITISCGIQGFDESEVVYFCEGESRDFVFKRK